MQRIVSLSQLTLEGPDPAPPAPLTLRSLQKLGRLLGIRTSPASSSPKYCPSSQVPATSATPPQYPTPPSAPSAFSDFPFLNDDHSSRNTSSSHATTKPAGSRRRPRLHHSVSTPAMYPINTQSGSRSSTSIPSRGGECQYFVRFCFSYLFPGEQGDSAVSLLKNLQPSTSPRSSRVRPSTASTQTSETRLRWRWQKKDKRSISVQEASSPPRSHSTIPWSEPLGLVAQLPPIEHSLSIQDLRLTPMTTIGSTASDSRTYTPDLPPCGRSVNKLARTLGIFPADISALTKLPPCDPSTPPYPLTPDSSSFHAIKEPPKPKIIRRMSLSLSTIASLPSLFRSPSQSPRPQKPSPSRASLSTLNTDVGDIHHFDLADDLSENWGWGEMRDDSCASTDSPISPITFQPPTPIAGPANKASSPPWAAQLSGRTSPEVRRSSRRTSKISLARARSQTYVSSQFAQRAEARSRAQTPMLLDTQDYVHGLPVRANWLDAASPAARDGGEDVTVSPADTDVDREPRTWSGQWNQGDMQQVIKRLRDLR